MWRAMLCAVEPSEEILDFIRRGRKIDAIKAYRQQYGVGLRDAKDAVDRLQVSGTAGLPQPIRQEIVVHRKSGGSPAVMRWYAKDVQAMAAQGYVETTHQTMEQAQGCASFFLPKRSQMVVTYRLNSRERE